MTSFIQDTDNMTLCIPRVFSNIGENRIRSVFYALKLGHIGRIDIVSKITERGEKFNRVFIHFERWFDTANSQRALELLREGKDIKVIYDEPWFWKVSIYRKPVHVTKAPSKQEPVIVTEDLEATYDSSVPILNYKSTPFPRRKKLVPKKQQFNVIAKYEIEDGEIVESSQDILE